MNLWEKYDTSFTENASERAFYIGNRFYSYAEFRQYISGSQQLLHSHIDLSTGYPIGVMCHDSIETFAAIFAIWFSGCHFVPLNPLHPGYTNNEKIQQSGIQWIFDQEVSSINKELNVNYLNNKDLKSHGSLIFFKESDCAYILFTSGSTGKPKGVPININNLTAFVDDFLDLYPDLTSSDRFLQTYDLTSDASFTGYLIPLLLGATVYTIPAGSFKYLSIVKILQGHQITWTQFTPSILSYLRPYFKSIRFESLKHSHFGGESLPYELVSEWAECVPNAEISNIYGPTETTITCTVHRTTIDHLKDNIYNGIISIGIPFKNVKILILDETDQIVAEGQKGELCIGGNQVMDGYLNSPVETTKTFYIHEFAGINERYYRSGDLVFKDIKGNLFFCGRKDDQLKISGYRIEPAEIEYAVSQLAHGSNSKAYGFQNKSGTESIVVFIEQYKESTEILKEKLRSMLFSALIPEKIISVKQFPLNQNGKVDKSILFENYSNQIYD